MSPASPPAVVPGGPATPPARRGSAQAANAPVDLGAPEADEIEIEGEPSAEDLAALYAMVTPSAHDDMKPDAKQAEARRDPNGAAQPAVAATAPAGPNVWKRIVLGGAAIIAIAAVTLGANAIVNGAVGRSPGCKPGRRGDKRRTGRRRGQGREPDGQVPGRPEGRRDAPGPGRRVLRRRPVRGRCDLARQAPRDRSRAHPGPPRPRRRVLQPQRPGQRRGDLEEGRHHRARQRRGPLRPRLPLPEPGEPGLGRRPGGVDQGHRARSRAPSWPRRCRSHLDSLAKASMVPGASAGASSSPAASPSPSASPAASAPASPAASAVP